MPEGANIGLGVKTAAIRNLHVQGALTNTGNKLDLALMGEGWFQIEGADGQTLYSRAGAFNTNATGQLVTVDGFNVIPAITIPPEAVEVIVNSSGQKWRNGTRNCGGQRRPRTRSAQYRCAGWPPC